MSGSSDVLSVTSTPAPPTEASISTLQVDQEIIEREASLAESKFIKRFTLSWMLIGNPAIVCGVVAGNLYIDFSTPGDGQLSLNVFGVISFVASTSGSIFWWNCYRKETTRHEVKLRQLDTSRRALQVSNPGSRALPPAFHSYHESIPNFRDEYRRSAEKYRSRHNLFQLTVIVGSILTSVSTTAAAEEGAWSWIAVSVSALVSISAGIISYFKFRERSLNLQQTADSIDLEIQAYALRIRRYKNLSPEEASAQFSEEVERIREEQRKKELQLEQPPEATPQQRTQPA